MITAKTQLLAIIGDPISHSLSPLMQNAALEQCGIDARYMAFHVVPEDLEYAIAGLRSLNIWGCNVTVPHKEKIIPFLDDLDIAAKRIGAVNTVVNDSGRLVGYNTDGGGLLASLRDDLGFNPSGKKVILLGAGGASRAALVAFAGAGVTWLGVVNRNEERGRGLVDNFRGEFLGTTFAAFAMWSQTLDAAFQDVDLVVNTTSVGLNGTSFPDFPWESLPNTALIYDMVYTKNGTLLVKTALMKGFSSADGVGMLAGQGELAFRLWTGLVPKPGLMKQVLCQHLGRPDGLLDST